MAFAYLFLVLIIGEESIGEIGEATLTGAATLIVGTPIFAISCLAAAKTVGQLMVQIECDGKYYKNSITQVPTNIITGFLGVGKTTVIQKLLSKKPARRALGCIGQRVW